jgi:outer membrane protein TolC
MRAIQKLSSLALAAAIASAATTAHAQITLAAAVDLALRNNPRVKMAESEAAKARASLAETHDVYVPSLTAGAGLGQSYGYSPNPPTLFYFTAQSLVYSASQFAYIRSARTGLEAANFALQDTREAVAEDTALTFVALQHDQDRYQVLRQQSEYADKLVNITSTRLNAGRDTAIDLTTAKLSAAQFRYALLRAEDEIGNDSAHLQRLMVQPITKITADGSFPTAPITIEAPSNYAGSPNAAIAAAFATARAKQQQADGDARFLYRPNVALIVQYNNYATFTASFQQLNAVRSAADQIGANEEVFGVQISIPLFDRGRKDKAREAAAEARRSFHEAENSQIAILDGETKISHTIEELKARAEVASLEQQLAQQQLDILQLQLNSNVPGPGPQMTPKDEQNSRIAEREKYLGVIDTSFQLHQAEISLLRQTGRLEEWLHQAALSATPVNPAPAQPHP